MKRLVMAIMTLVFLMSVVFVLPACAETVIRDGIEVTLTTDKESYDSMNAVNARLTITNTNSFAVKNVTTEITAPDGYVLNGNAEEEHGTLQAGQSQTQDAAVYRADYAPKLPKTGDSSHLGRWAVLLLLCIAGICALMRNKHAQRFLSVLLCMAILSPYVLHAVPAKAQTNESTIIVKKNVAVAGKNVTLTGTVGYEVPTSSAFAMRSAEATPVNELAYITEGTEITITGYTGSSVSLVIPEYIDGKPVTKIGYNYGGNTGKKLTGVDSVKELVLPDTVKTISSYAFEKCKNLESIQFSKNLSYIGGMAFNGCDSLTEISIHTTGDLNIAGVVDENGLTFAYCDNLKTVIIECDGDLALAGDGIFMQCTRLEEVSLTTSKYLIIGRYAFFEDTPKYGLKTNVKIKAKDGANIRDKAFCSTALNTLLLQVEGPVTLGNSVFSGCTYLRSLTLLSNVISIGESAFRFCGINFDGFTIRGNRGSYVENYVKEHNASVEGGDPRDIIEFVAVEDDCDHSSGLHSTFKDSDSVTQYRLNPEDESSHPNGHQIGNTYTRYCADCGMPIQTDILIWDGFEAHKMVNGVCTKCSYTEKSKELASIVGFALDEDSVTIGNDVHVKSGMAYGGDYYLRKIQISVFTDNSGNHGYYSNVSKEFAYGEATSYDLSKLGAIVINGRFTCEAHKTEEAFPAGDAMVMVFVSVYNEDGTDGENTFGADAADTVVVSCAHPTYTDVHNASIPIRYTDNNDGKTHIWQSGYDRICNTCHENLGVVYGVENTAEHDYTNGDVCPCGYDRSNCQHTPSEIKTYNRHLFAPLNEKQHQTIAIVWDMVCSTCGKTYEEIDTVGDEIGVTYDHVWEDGKCKVLGCEYQCEHAFEDIMLPDGNHKAENGIWESKGENGHWCSSIEYWEKCVNCGLEQKYTKLMPYGEEVQPHMMNVVNKTYYAFDENEHWLIGEDKQCTAKGCDYSNYVEKQIIAREAHKYLGGTCICGAKEKTIQNENSTPVTDSSENRKENSIDSNYVYGYELGYDEDDFLYNERLYLTDEARAVWDELSLNKKQIWFEFNVYIISLERFGFESFGDSSSNKILTKEDKIAMAKVIISAWHREIARDNPQFRISGSQKQKIGDLANMQNELDKIIKQTDSYEALGNLLDIASLIPGLPQVVGELGDVFGYGLKAKETWTKEDLAELVVEIEKYKMEIVGDSLKKNGLDLGLEEDMQSIIEELIDEAINTQKNNIEIAVNQTKTELNAIIDITLGIATGGIVPAVKAGISATENKNKDEIDELERILKGAVKVYLERTKPQLEEAIQNYTDSPTMENYLNMCNGVNGKLDMWLLQSRELSEIYWSWRRLKEEDEEKYILESYQELKYIEDTFEKLSHVEWGYGLISY